MIPIEKIKFYVRLNKNILLIGQHGIGKSTVVCKALEEEGIKYKYFSCATLDPYIDFIGVPKEATNKDGVKYLDMVKPIEFANDEVEYLVLDEYNRAQAAVRNAVLELTQFGSINGKKFNNLRGVIGMINPDTADNIYDVEKLDPAQKDRFHVHLNLDYAPDVDYFTKKFGAETANHAIGWWNNLTGEEKFEISPRRLDYALEIQKLGGDLRDVIPERGNIQKLISNLTNGLPLDKLMFLIQSKSQRAIENFLKVENNYNDVISWILKEESRVTELVPLMPAEKISSLITTNIDDKVSTWILSTQNSNQRVSDVKQSILDSGADKIVKAKVRDKTPVKYPNNLGANPLFDDIYNTNVEPEDFISRFSEIAKNRSWEQVENHQSLEDFFTSSLSVSGKSLSDTVCNALIVPVVAIISNKMKDNQPIEKNLACLNFLLKKNNLHITNQIVNGQKICKYNLFVNQLVDLNMEDKVWTPN